MNDIAMIAPVRKSVHVEVPIARAFEFFTVGLSQWWPLDHGMGKTPRRRVSMEPRLHGRWFETAEDGTETTVATITLWNPPHRVVLTWQVNAQCQPDPTMKSEVDVHFTAEGADATLVELLHHKFETLGTREGTALRNSVQGGWPGLMERYAQEAVRGGA
jgi:uncharacterized protein YndB with AHSA1/START domain